MNRRLTTTSDPARSLALLWGAQGKTGRSGLSVRSIVAAAMKLADAEGFAAVSMSSIAACLKAGTMSLYTHVPSKADLTDLMIDTANGELYEDATTPFQQKGGWRGSLEFIAKRNWELYQRHPWLLQAVAARPVLGPNTTLKYEAELRPLDNLGLTDAEMDLVLSLVLTHVEATARLQASLRQSQADSGMSDMEWWVSNEPALHRMMDAKRFPTASRVGESVGQEYQSAANPAQTLAFGLSRILDGVEMFIAKRKRPAKRK